LLSLTESFIKANFSQFAKIRIIDTAFLIFALYLHEVKKQKLMNQFLQLHNAKPFRSELLIISSLFILTLLSGCKKDPAKSWTFYTDSPPPLEIVEMSAVVKNCEPPYPVTFYQETENLIGTVTYFWDFGDGNTSTDQNPNHIYTTPGDYTIMFVVTNEIGSDTAYLTVPELAMSSIPVVAGFSYSHFNSNLFAPNKVVFKNESSGANQFYWYFGDGEESNDADPEHVFETAGTYNVRLRGTCTDGTFNEITQQISVIDAPDRVFIDSINLMLPSSYKNTSLYIEMYHNTTYVGSTTVKSPSSFPVKFRRPWDFPGGYFFDYVQFSGGEVFRFLVFRPVIDNPPQLLMEFTYSSYAIQAEFYPTAIYQIEVPPFDPLDVFIDLYVSY
jgi:PKD repeat protein